MIRSESSRTRFAAYLRKARQQRKDPGRTDKHGRTIARTRSFRELLGEFVRLLRDHRGVMIAALVTLTLSTLIGLVPLYAPKLVIDNVLGSEPMPALLAGWLPGVDRPKLLLIVIAAVTLALTFLAVGIGLWGRWHATRITKRMQADVRRRTFEHAARLPLHRVYELKAGGVAGILRDDAGAVGNLIFGMIYNPWRALIQFLGTLLVLTLIDWKLLLGGLCILPVVWLTHRTWIARIRPMFRDVRKSRTVIDGHSTEVFGGMRVVRAFGRQRAEAGSFVNHNHLMIRQELNTWWWMRGVDTAWAVIIPVASAALLLYGGWRILDDRAAVAAGGLAAEDALTVGDLVVFLGYLAALLGPIATLAATATSLQNDLAALDRTLDLLAEDREMPAAEGARVLERDAVAGRITFEDVAFAYPRAETPVFEEVDLDALPGQTVALVGPSGAGKTTLCNLVARFYDPTAGRVRLDGTDLRDIDIDSYRQILGVVEQDVFLFDGTIAANIAYARPSRKWAATDPDDAEEAQRDAVVQAAKLANAHGFITDMPRGYDTRIGERGVKLSGGQRQRLAIARAIHADPRILILDEATSNLDTESERLIQASLRGLMQGRTCFIIAHRLSTITHADQILVVNHGRIIERGTHEQLMAAGGIYRGMIEVQLDPQRREAAVADAV
jgi:ATP-binding cassette subfamily B protein/subfamily B ATP-binding cassette protein MsbA